MSTTTMNTSEFGAYYRLFEMKYNELFQLLADLPDEALLWKPFEISPWHGECAPLGWLIAHAVSSAVYLLRRAEWIQGRREWVDVDGDEGAEEYGIANREVEYLYERVRRTQSYVYESLNVFEGTDLDASRRHPSRPSSLTVRFDIQHAIEHMSQHIGHAQLTRQLWALQQT